MKNWAVLAEDIPKLSIAEIRALARTTLEGSYDLVAQSLERCTERLGAIEQPIIAFLGHGRCGKDTAAAWLGSNYEIQYAGSVSKAIVPLIAAATNQTEEEAFAKRHQQRGFWFEFCNGLREDDPTILTRLTLADNDVVAGVRAAIEYEACRHAGLIDYAVWIKRDVANDPTLELTEEDCDLTILNTTNLTDFYKKLRTFAEILNLPNNLI